MLKLIVSRQGGVIRCAQAGNSAAWDSGATTAEAIGKWIITHGQPHVLVVVEPNGDATKAEALERSKGTRHETEILAFAPSVD